MSEMIDATSREFPGFFVIAAIARAKALGELIPGNPVEVCLTVNGVELPFTETMNDIYQRMERQLDQAIQERAAKLVTAAGLDGLAEALREAEEKVKDAIQRALAKVPTQR